MKRNCPFENMQVKGKLYVVFNMKFTENNLILFSKYKAFLSAREHLKCLVYSVVNFSNIIAKCVLQFTQKIATFCKRYCKY